MDVCFYRKILISTLISGQLGERFSHIMFARYQSGRKKHRKYDEK